MGDCSAAAPDINRLDVEGHAQRIEADGYTIIPDAITAEQARGAIQALEEVYERERTIAERFGEQTANQNVGRNVIGKHRFFENFFQNAPVVAVCREVLGDDMVLYDTTARSVLPGGGREERHGFQVHVDREEFTVLPFRDGTHFPVAINVIWTLVDFTTNNGATVIWPGTHRSLEVPDSAGDYGGFLQAVTPAGSAGMGDAATWHATGLNQSDHVRHSAIAFYQRSWVKGMISNESVMPPEVRARLRPEMRRLLGLERSLPDYSSVRRLSQEQIDQLSPLEKRVIGIGIY